jgi:glycosyltransferase involved in cell wall biosynthesis
MRDEPVSILLATRNGAPFVREQIESIRSQSVTDWTLVIRDDGSTDGTGDILRELAGSDSRIVIVSDALGRLGAAGNFSMLATRALTGPPGPVLFADQDDVWFPVKIERTLAALRRAEAARPARTPILVHSDLTVIDRQGRHRHDSFMRFQRIRHDGAQALRTLVVQNFVTGCTVMVNRPLLELAIPVPSGAMMHDWWLALCAAACGSIEFIETPTMAYRRHGANAMTARGFWRTMNPGLTNWWALWREGLRNHVRAVAQAHAVLARLRAAGCGSPGSIEFIEAFTRMHVQPAPRRVSGALRLGLRSQTLPRTAVLYARLLCRT